MENRVTREIIAVSPFDCRMWDRHDRLEDHVNEETCRAEIASFATHGQLIPVLGRPLEGDPKFKIELVFGSRRLFVARHLNRQLLVELRNLSDREAIIAIDIENRQRKSVSPYERGLSYARWLKDGYFRSQDDLARTLKVSISQVSRLLKLAQLPEVVVGAFDSPADIREVWGLRLVEGLEDTSSGAGIIKAARALGTTSPRPPAREIYRRLADVSGGTRAQRLSARTEVIGHESRSPLFRIVYHQDKTVLVVPAVWISAQALDLIRQRIVAILER